MNMQNGHDAKVHTLNPTNNGICQVKLTEVHPSSISWHPLLTEIFNSLISARTYHGQRVATSVLCGAYQFESQIWPWGRYATLYKTAYSFQSYLLLAHCYTISLVKPAVTWITDKTPSLKIILTGISFSIMWVMSHVKICFLQAKDITFYARWHHQFQTHRWRS